MAGFVSVMNRFHERAHRVDDRGYQWMREWLSNVASPAKVHEASPAEMESKEGLSLYLMQLLGQPPLRGNPKLPLVISLRYLVTVWFKEPAQAAQTLGELTFAAMEAKDLELEPEPVSMEMWRAFGVAPRPSVVLRVPLRKPREIPRGPRVQGGLEVRYSGMKPLQGRVSGPGGIAIMGARITLPSLRRTTRTDSRGRFQFSGVPTGMPVRTLQINARGREVTWAIDSQTDDGPLLIELTDNQI